LRIIISTRYVGCDGPIQSARMINMTKDPTVAIRIVKNKMMANFSKKMIVVKSMMVAAAIVVKAAAKMEGPM